ncbi:MAG: peptidoglycan DD-metalloendopeptidase family protein [Candidatus Omnitrophica bacterium]|nr:peptidoglycan DD-metalloendopeptidase family protein [Candidatus Omnitrophota bacterium]
MKIKLSAFFLFLALGCASRPDSGKIQPVPDYREAATVVQEPSLITHKVRKGETLYKISKDYNVSMKDIIALNNIKDPSLIKEGQSISVPKVRSTAALSLPSGNFIWPLEGKVVSFFKDDTSKGPNKGIDIQALRPAPVVASRGGQICYAGEDIKGYGKVVMIDHNDGYYSLYAYNKAILVSKGTTVKQGEKIALLDEVKPVLHFEIRKENKPIDPLQFLK